MPGIEAVEYEDHPGCDADGLSGFDNIVIPGRAAERTRKSRAATYRFRVRVFGAARNGNGEPRRASHLRIAIRADRGDAQHVGGAGSAERHAGDDDDTLSGPGKTVAKRD